MNLLPTEHPGSDKALSDTWGPGALARAPAGTRPANAEAAPQPQPSAPRPAIPANSSQQREA
eukprot:scaffold19984_cov127-Isochrysis_galbana.AAC.13